MVFYDCFPYLEGYGYLNPLSLLEEYSNLCPLSPYLEVWYFKSTFSLFERVWYSKPTVSLFERVNILSTLSLFGRVWCSL